MMSDPTSPDVWSTLLPVIIGGAIGFLGGIAGPPLTQLFSNIAVTRQRRIDRFEELLSIVLEHDNWLERVRLHRMFGDSESPTDKEPLPRAVALARIYFDGLAGSLDTLETANRQYQLWLSQAWERRTKSGLESVNDGFGSAFKAYADTRRKTVDAIVRYGKETLRLT
jgi:hypothetical protein